MSKAKNQAERQEPDHGDLCRSNVAFMSNVMGSHWKALTCIFKISLVVVGVGGLGHGGWGEGKAANRGCCNNPGEKWWWLGLG